MSVVELQARRGNEDPSTHPLLLDVREAWELERAALPQVLHIPMGEIATRLDAIRTQSAAKDVVVMCRSGQRSLAVAKYLQQNGIERVFNLDGGILAWSQLIDDSVHPY